jgi:hypothetical protein
MRWSELTAAMGLEYFRSIARKIGHGELDFGRQHYALMLAHAIQAAMSSGLGRVSVVELGVARGDGLLSLCKAAAFFRQDLDIRVYGFDTGSGLSDLGVDYRDHPELFHNGEFPMSDVGELRAKLPEFAELVMGDVGETIATFETTLRERPLVFASFDLDLYPSTKRALPLLKFDPSCHPPVVPLDFDDMECKMNGPGHTWRLMNLMPNRSCAGSGGSSMSGSS